MTEYYVVIANTSETLSEEVNALLSEGFRVSGSLAVSVFREDAAVFYAQPMIRDMK